MRILVTDGMDKTAMAQLREMGHEVVEQFYEPDQLGKALRDFDVVVVRSKTKVRANHIDEAKGSNLKLIIRGGVGVDNIDVKYAEANGIAVKNTPKASSQSVAELAMGHMFACARYISDAGYTMRNGEWKKKEYGKGIELQGKTLGIVGFGRIGQHLGIMAKAIGMNVIAFDIFHIPGIEEQLGIPYVEMDELLAKADFVSVHAPAVDGGDRQHRRHRRRQADVRRHRTEFRQSRHDGAYHFNGLVPHGDGALDSAACERMERGRRHHGDADGVPRRLVGRQSVRRSALALADARRLSRRLDG